MRARVCAQNDTRISADNYQGRAAGLTQIVCQLKGRETIIMIEFT